MTSPATTSWPSLRVSDWTPTRDTLHMWTQIVGKIRMAHAPLLNHWWQVTLYVSPRGLTTSTIPYRTGRLRDRVRLPRPPARDPHQHRRHAEPPARDRCPSPSSTPEILDMLDQLGIEAPIRPHPNEVDPAIPFAEDHVHASYDGEAATLFWRQLLQANRVIGEFRSHFVGKVSPVHFFWGAHGPRLHPLLRAAAPPHPGGAPNCADWVMVEGYSRELSSCGFWPGGGEEGAFYSYAYPAPDGFADQPIGPDGAYFSTEFQQFLLPYEAARAAPDPTARSPSSSAPPTTPPRTSDTGTAPRWRTTPSGGTEPLRLGETKKPDRPTMLP